MPLPQREEALTLGGTVISICDDRHRHQEWLKFLHIIDDVTPPDKELHLIADNYATHEHPKQRGRHAIPASTCISLPNSSLCLNMVERWFRNLTEREGSAAAYSAMSRN